MTAAGNEHEQRVKNKKRGIPCLGRETTLTRDFSPDVATSEQGHGATKGEEEAARDRNKKEL